MATSLATLNTLINDRRRDTTNLSIDMTAEGFRAINGTLQIWNQEHDWPWQINKQMINYNEGVTYYQIPNSWDFKAVVDVQPQKLVQMKDDLYYLSANGFDRDSVHTYKFAVKTEGQLNTLRMKYRGWNQLIDPMAAYNSNGTWVGAGAISSVASDVFDYWEQSGSISFNYSGTSGTLTNSTLSPLDLSRYLGRSNIFVNAYLQIITNFSGLTLKIGSDASNYITVSSTADFLGATPIVGWNKFAFAWTGTTTVVGTPNYAAITYVQLTLTYSGSETSVSNNFENLFVSENVPMLVDFYTNNMVADSSAAQYQIFQSASTTSDPTLWTGTWDWVNEIFTNSAMETITYMTGEQADEMVVRKNVLDHLEPLKARLPSRRRYPQYQISPDVNGEYYGPRPLPYRRW